MRLVNIFRLGIKELRGLARDPVLVALVAYTFTLQVYSESTAISDVPHNAPIAVVDEDHSQLSERIINDFYPPDFTLPPVITTTEMDHRLDAGTDTFALDVPPHFQRDVLTNRSPAIQLNVDANQMTEAFAGTSAVENIVAGEVTDFLQRHRSDASAQVDVELRTRYNPNRIQQWFLSVTSIMDSITLMTIILTGAALIREREHGTVEHLLVMPVTAVEIMLSKIWAMGLVVLFASVFSLIVVVQGALAVPVQGSVLLFTFGAALDILASAALGIALATIAELDAAVRSVGDPRHIAFAGSLRESFAAREHAASYPHADARRAEYAFCGTRAVRPVSRRGAWGRLAATSGACRDRRHPVRVFTLAVPSLPAVALQYAMVWQANRASGALRFSLPLSFGNRAFVN